MKQLHYLPLLLITPLLARDLRPLPAMTPPAGLKVADWAQIRAEYERHKHTAFPDGQGFTSRNRAQQWRAHFDGRGFEIRPDGKRWTLALDLIEYAGKPVQAIAKPVVEKNRVSYQRSLGIEEWFLNDQRGLEQGFTVSEKQGRAELVLRVRGGLRPQGAGLAIRFVDAAGNGVMNYSGLRAWDANGTTLPSRMETAGDTVRVIVDDRGALYPIQIDPVVQQAFLKPDVVGSTQVGDGFGGSVAISGNTVVVGARGEDSGNVGINGTPNEAATDSGAAYVFVRDGFGVWKQEAFLKPKNVGAGDFFGASVAISGDIIAVGAYLEDSATVGINSSPINDLAQDSGAAYIFARSGTTWIEQAYLKPNAVGNGQIRDWFGASVAVSGETVVVGAPNEGSTTTGTTSTPNELGVNCGAAYVYVRVAGSWTWQAYLKPGGFGSTQNGDGFGQSVAISGNTIVVGSPGESTNRTGNIQGQSQDESALTSGAAFVFERTGSAWAQTALLKAGVVGQTSVQDIFGSSVAIDGNLIVVGAPFEDSATSGVNTTPNESAQDRGAAFVYIRTGGTWAYEAYLKPTSLLSIKYFGVSAAISGNTAVLGSDFANAAFVFVRSGAGVWNQEVVLQNTNGGNTTTGDAFGNSVAVSGDTVIAGAPGEDSAVRGINKLPDENASNAGAGLVYSGVGSAPAPLQFVPIAPCRMVDTRNPTGQLGGPALAALATRNFPIRAACGVPANTTAYSLNITVVPRGSLGYLTIWPGGLSQPLVSTLNSLDGRIKANAAVVPAGSDGSVNVFVTDLADVLIDVNGVFVPQGTNTNGQAFYPVTPCRIVDSRLTGGGGTLAANTTRAVIVANAGGCGIPTSATAYATNVTVVPKQPLGFLTLWTGGSGSARPTVSTLNALTGAVTANLAIVPAGTAGDINAFATDATDLIVDVTGYFGPPGGANALNFYSLLPCRVVDTRLPDGALGGPIPARDSTRNFPVLSSSCNVPATARAYSMNATVVPSPTLGFLTLFPVGVSRPTVSTLNAVDGSLTANAAIVPAGTTGQISAYFTDPAHLILDINGYFAP